MKIKATVVTDEEHTVVEQSKFAFGQAPSQTPREVGVLSFLAPTQPQVTLAAAEQPAEMLPETGSFSRGGIDGRIGNRNVAGTGGRPAELWAVNAQGFVQQILPNGPFSSTPVIRSKIKEFKHGSQSDSLSRPDLPNGRQRRACAKSRAEVPKKAGCEVRSKVIGLDLLSRKSVARSTTSLITRSTHRGGATRRRSLRPLGARSSQEYLPQMASTPRA